MSETVEYIWAPRLRARALGVLMFGLSLAIVIITLLGWFLDSDPTTMAVTVAVFVAGFLVAGFVVSRRRWVVRTDATGYVVRGGFAAGVKQAQWSEVETLVTATVNGARCLVVRLRNGGQTTIPVDILQVSGERFSTEFRDQLSRARRG